MYDISNYLLNLHEKTMEIKEKKQGGRRPGAGRPKLDAEIKAKQLTITVNHEIWHALNDTQIRDAAMYGIHAKMESLKK